MKILLQPAIVCASRGTHSLSPTVSVIISMYASISCILSTVLVAAIHSNLDAVLRTSLPLPQLLSHNPSIPNFISFASKV